MKKLKIYTLVIFLFLYVALCFAEDTNLSLEQIDFTEIKSNMERILSENIIPFWYPKAIDTEDGGYRLNHDIEGKWIGPSDKFLVTQARTLWFFSALARSKYGKLEHLQAAEHGYKFLRDKMWDKEYGGFYWAVNSTGSEAVIPFKHLYGQSFGLYALSEYFIASGDQDAKRLARRFFNILEFLSHDKLYGGYRESFTREWSPMEENDKNPMGSAPDIKLMNTHLHLMEAITTYYQATKDPVARERLIELINIQSNSVVRKTIGACTDKYKRDWTPISSPEFNRVSYGHDIENIWLLIEACNGIGINNYPLVDLYRTLFDYSLKYGYDQEKGGFYDSGSFNEKAKRREKVWWVQSECIVGALNMYYLTGDAIYLDCFIRTLDWIMKYQIDWTNGEWFASISESGESSGAKSGAWKSAYHNGRAMIKCIELLDSLTK